jgi:hypothetical protein
MPAPCAMAEIAFRFSQRKGLAADEVVPASRRIKRNVLRADAGDALLEFVEVDVALEQAIAFRLRPSSTTSSSTAPPTRVICALVVVKW